MIVGNDYTEEKLYSEELGINDRRIRFINHENNLGEIKNMNFLLNEAGGRYFTWLGDDDAYYPYFLESIHKGFITHDKLDCVFSNYNFTLNGKVHRLITRLSIDNLLHPFQPWILGQRAFPNKFASLVKVPLVIYGENPGEYEQNWGKVDYGEDVIHELHSIEENEELFIAGYNVDLLKSKLKL